MGDISVNLSQHEDISVSLYQHEDISVNFPHDDLVWGDNLVESGKDDFDTDDDKESWQVNNSNTWSVADSALSVTYVDGDLGARIIFQAGEFGDLTTDLTQGNTYKVSVRYKTNSAFKFRVYRGFGEDTVDSDELTSTDWAWVVLEWECVNATGDDLRMAEFGEGDTVWIDRYVVQEEL